MVQKRKKPKAKTKDLPEIPNKLYFGISEVGALCALEPHVLRYWEQEFYQLRPTKGQGNRRYYQRKDIVLIRRIRELLYERGFTIDGARSQLMGGNNKDLNASKARESYDKSQLISQLEEVLEALEGA